MSEVNAGDQTEINSKDDVWHLYKGAGDDAMIGLEAEMAFFNAKDPNLTPMSIEQNEQLKASAQSALPNADEWVRIEPTAELMEVNSIARKSADIKDVIADTKIKIKTLTDQATKLDLKRSYFQELPEQTAADLLQHIIKVDRYKAMYWPYREDMLGCVEYFAICKSNQVSVSYHNPDHLLENTRRLYLLAPFLFLLTDNSAAFMEGKPFSGHVGMHLRHRGLTEGRGNVVPYVLTAKTGDEFIENHIDHVMNNPLFMHYDLDGNLIKVPSGDWSVTFNTLKERGLGIASNYFLAQSILWPDVKIAALKDENGNPINHRYEGRMFGVGIHQHQTALLIMNALAFKPDFAAATDALLTKYGLDPHNSAQIQENIPISYRAAREHNGEFFNISYGSGNMANFAKEFADLIESAYDGEGLDGELAPMLHICRTGLTDGRVNRTLFPTLEKTLEFQRTRPEGIFQNPNQCAAMLFEKELKSAA